jgi:hypothetical protein
MSSVIVNVIDNSERIEVTFSDLGLTGPPADSAIMNSGGITGGAANTLPNRMVGDNTLKTWRLLVTETALISAIASGGISDLRPGDSIEIIDPNATLA